MSHGRTVPRPARLASREHQHREGSARRIGHPSFLLLFADRPDYRSGGWWKRWLLRGAECRCYYGIELVSFRLDFRTSSSRGGSHGLSNRSDGPYQACQSQRWSRRLLSEALAGSTLSVGSLHSSTRPFHPHPGWCLSTGGPWLSPRSPPTFVFLVEFFRFAYFNPTPPSPSGVTDIPSRFRISPQSVYWASSR